ncbi:hypothetical protein QBC33DRAFT_552908 [Phialemonium atrogriseum]|uniref:Rhodopsin domain-containing protein n=1 Tax=Phialemonium atrogriseum TaxID=1093897 RepID=A0AAJ0FB20_9PEZI|nr:uncharacterized protein QBC33DRAFT_552908 [Phialemonium atrogriseum]KAK1762011.1 hypothetical protein QBC33DRAFT_552908 [Phialemonium atrogriseum]
MASDKLGTTIVPLSSRPEIAQIVNTAIVFCVLIGIWSGLRVYARRVRHISPLNTEDVLFYISVAAFYGMVIALFLVLYLGGVGYHMDQLRPVHIARLTQSILAIQGLYGLSMCTSKWSILWMLKRIFAVRSFQIVTWAIIIVQAAWMIMTVLIGLLICRPVQKNWDPTVEGTCGNQIAGYTAVSVYNVIVDVAMCILPIPMIYKLQVKKPYKVALFGIFSIGIVTLVFSILRLLSLRSIDFDNFSYSVTGVIIWTYAETGVVILVACSPLLRPIFDKIFRRFLSSARGEPPRTSHPSLDHLNSSTGRAKIRRKRRSGFVTVGESEESLELGDVTGGGHVETRVMAGRSNRFARGGMLRRETSDQDLQMGIVVEKEVSQTVNLAR